MIFTIGVFLFLIGHYWYVGSETYGDWRDTAQLLLKIVGVVLICVSLSSLTIKYLP